MPFSRFVHLHVHSHYSLLEALPKVKALIKATKEKGMDTFALTDNGTLYGVIEAYQKAQDEGVKLIVGMDAYVAPAGRHQKRARIDTKPNRLVLLAENNDGYRTLVRLSSLGFLEGFYYKPRIDKELLREFCLGKSHGLIALSGGRFGDIDQALQMGNREHAVALIGEYRQIFGEGNFYLELVDRPEIPEQAAVNAQLIELGKELGVPVVATKNAFYLKPDEAEAWKILQCVQGGKTLEQFERLQAYDYDASFVSPQEMEEQFKDVPEAIENTRVIADRCNVTFELGKWNFAHFEVPDGLTHLEYLRQRAYAELARKVPELTEEMRQRIDYELSVIEVKGFAPYFLIVSDYIEWARKNGIVTTTRGSAAGSLVSYAIGISSVDPLRYKLPFERFLNPERPSAPDVDADFADNRRDEMLAYVTEKYGKDKVAQICTFGTMMARGSIRDVGRALGIPYGFVDQIAKLVPMGSQGFPMTLERALEEAEDLKKQYDADPQVKRLIDLARRIEGCARHVSIHAAGVVISPEPLTEFTPLQVETKEGKVITQYEMKSVEAAGLLKMDFLGIRNLSILGDAVKILKHIKDLDIDLERIPVDDPKTFELLAKGYTMGTFQLNGDGMTKYLMELRPERIEDIMAMVALYRPGPIESIPEYIRRKHDPSLVSYLDPRMKEFLESSYGVIVYQEDVMFIAIKMAGYSWLEADKLRKAMGKKIPEEMQKQKDKLIDGLVAGGLSASKSKELWKLIEPFAAYGFGKAHAASYGMIAYYTAYLKANYPAEYMSALMTAESGDLDTVADAVKECERLGIKVLPPDVNESLSTFTYIDDQTIRFGLLVIKNLGEEVIQAIIAEREARGPFIDLTDFAERVHHRAFNKKSLEALAKSGALDRFGERRQLLDNVDQILLFNRQAQQQSSQNQSSLFDLAPALVQEKLRLRPASAAAKRGELLGWEKEVLGLYVSAHPYHAVAPRLASFVISLADAVASPEGAVVRCGGLVSSVKKIVTKKGDSMAFVELEDGRTKTEVVCFPKVFLSSQDFLLPERVVIVGAKVSRREGEEPKLLANYFLLVDEDNVDQALAWLRMDGGGQAASAPADPTPPPAHAASVPPATPPDAAAGSPSAPLPSAAVPASAPPLLGLEIVLVGKPAHDLVEQLRSLFTSAPGPERVCFILESQGKPRRVQTDYAVAVSDAFLDALASLVGRQHVRWVKG
ncbi:DNA polymerase III subunit alpha [Candidatus Uhrbacteria bacterium]|nr:DNA polymerase III subunit alpha [Candidatus Uhrbacteria bacterium]